MKKKYGAIKTTLVFSVLFLGVFAINSNAQEMAVPAGLQAALFKKIFSFDKTLAAKGTIEVAVIGNGGDAIVSAFKDAGVSAKVSDQIPAGATIVYMMPGAASLKQQTASRGILSISGVSSYVEEGRISIGLGIEGGKPKIIVNMAQLKAEGQELSADLLSIAKIIQ